MFVLDTCVLFPTVVRNILLELALADEYKPIWSEEIMKEWLWSSEKRGSMSRESAKIEIMQTNLRFPNSMWSLNKFVAEDYWLPDYDDIHVLALAIQSKAEGIITFNRKDFPNKILRNYKLFSITPDQFISSIFRVNPDLVLRVCNQELDDINEILVEPLIIESLLKKAQLPKLAKLIL